MFRDLYEHMEWADAVVWRAVLANETAAKDHRVRDVLLHYHFTQRAFLMIWRAEEMQFPHRESFTTAEQILQVARDYYAQLAPWLAALDETTLDREMVMPWAERFRQGASPTTMRDTLLQVPMHSTYHRGQVNARLREVGGEPPLTDYIAWVWMGKPRPEW